MTRFVQGLFLGLVIAFTAASFRPVSDLSELEDRQCQQCFDALEKMVSDD